MKISPKQYAESLYQTVQGKKDSDIEYAIENFVKVLQINSDINKLDKIAEQFCKIWDREKGIIKAEVVSAKELGKEIVELLNSYITKLSGAEKVLIKEKVDKNILGGAIIKYEDKILDGSLKTKLGELKVEMVK